MPLAASPSASQHCAATKSPRRRLPGRRQKYARKLRFEHLEDRRVLATIYSANMDTNPGWTTSGQWAFGHPTGGGGLSYGNPDPSNGYTGSNVYGVNLSGDYSTAVGGPYYLTTGPIDCSGYTGVSLQFRRWLNTDTSSYVTATLDVSNNGTTWTNVYSNSSSVTDASWQLLQYNIGAYADNKATLYVRWGYQVKSYAFAYSGWNIDDVVVSGTSSDTTPPTVTNRVPAPGATITTGIVNIDVTFSEPVKSSGVGGVDAADLVLSGVGAGGATVGSPTNTTGNTWRFPVTGLSNGTLNVSLAPDINDLEDLAGNDLDPRPTQWTYTVETSRIAFTSSRDGNPEIYAVNPDGSGLTRLTNNAAEDAWPAVSRDASKIAFASNRDGNYEIYLMTVDGTGQTRLTNNTSSDRLPAFSPDGSKIAFTSTRDGNYEIYSMNANGTGQTRLTNSTYVDEDPAFSPDGTKIVYASDRNWSGVRHIWVMNSDGTGATQLTDGSAEDVAPAYSPDGTKIAFASFRDGNWETYVMNTDGSSQTRITSVSGPDESPSFSPNGSKIVFASNRAGASNYEIYVMNADGTGTTMIASSSSFDWYPSWGGYVPQSSPPTAVDLAAATDTGVANGDNITSLDNSSEGKALQFSVSGTVAGATVTVYAEGAAIGVAVAAGSTTTVTTNGAYDLADGSGAMTARQTEPGKTESADSPALSVTIDTAAPAAPGAPDLQAGSDSGISNTDNLTSDNTPTLDVSSTPYFRLYSGGTQISGNYLTGTTYTLAVQADGTYGYAVTAVDAAGNESGQSGTLSVTIDTAAPTAPSAPDLQAGSDTGISDTDNVTNDTTPTFDVGATPYYRCYRDSTRISGDYESGSTFTTAAQADGTSDYKLSAVDAAGNESAKSTGLSVTIDTGYAYAVTAQLTEDTGVSSVDRVTSDATPQLGVSFSEAVYGQDSDVTVLDPYTNPATPDAIAGWGSNTLTVAFTSPLAVDGEYAVTFRGTSTITDAAGNRLNNGSNETVTFALDTVAPAAPSAADLQTASDRGVSGTDNITNDTAPTFAVSAAPYFRFYRDSTRISGDYESGSTYTAAAQVDGTYDYQVTVVDAAGNESAKSVALSVTIDTAAPAAPSAPDLQAGSDTGVNDTDNVTRDVTPTFDASATPYFRLYRGSTKISGDYESGSYTASLQTDGTYDYKVTAVDAAGNESAQSAGLSVTIDTAYVYAVAAQLTEDTGVSSGDRLTSDTTPEVSVSFSEAVYGQDGDVTVLDPNANPMTPDAIAGWGSNTLTVTFSTPLTVDGEYAATFDGAGTITDAAGNPLNNGSHETMTFTLDTAAPATPSAADLQATSDSGVSDTDNVTNDATPTFAVSAAPYFRFYRDGTRISGDYESGTSYTLAGQADGTYDYTVTAVDAAGNESPASAALSVTIDTAAPAAPAAPDLQATSDSGVSDTDNVTNDTTPSFDVSAVPYFRLYRDTTQISGNYESGGNYTSPPQADGPYDYTLTAVDDAGNESAQSAGLSVTVDTAYVYAVAAQLTADTGVSSGDRLTSDTTPEVSVSFSEAVYGQDGDVTVLDPNANPMTPDAIAGWGSNTLTVTFSTPLTVDGEYAATFDGAGTITDAAGNPLNNGSHETMTFTLDTAAPATPSAADLQATSDSGVSDTDNVTNDATPTFAVSAAPYFRFYRDSTRISGDYESGSVYTAADQADGTYDYQVTAVDAAGNESAKSVTLSVTMDTTAPAAPPVVDLQATSDSGVSDTDNVTNDTTPSFDVSATPYFRFYRDGTRLNGDYESGGSYTPAAQADGTYDYTVSAVDEAGNESAASPPLIVTIDTWAPLGTAGGPIPLDPAFGDGGKVTTEFFAPNAATDDLGYDVAVQADGKIVVVGAGPSYVDWLSGPYNFALVRYNSNGTRDSTFGYGGSVRTDFGSSDAWASSLAIQADGKIVVAGYAYADDTDYDFVLARYNTDGSLDTSFGSRGKVTTDFGLGGTDVARGVAIQADGKIVAAGSAYQVGTSADFALARYNSDGSLDVGFGAGGLVTTDFGAEGDYARGLGIQADGKIVLAGYTDVLSDANGVNDRFVLARYRTDGTLDGSFDGDGRVTSGQGHAYAMAIQPDGKIVAGGYLKGAVWGFGARRYNADGSLNTTFGPVDLGDADIAYDVALQPDGKIVLAGHSMWDFALVRFSGGGGLDTSFGTGGVVVADIVSYGDDVAYGVTVQPDGKIVAAGFADSGDEDFALARFNSTGTLDATFGTGGTLLSNVGASSTDEGRGMVLLQPDGKVVVAGNSYQGAGATSFDFAVARYDSDGRLDSSFGGDGRVVTDLGADDWDQAYAVASQADGKIIVAGYTGDSSRQNLALVRYNTDGSLDTGFSGDGRVTTDVGSIRDAAYALAIQADGKIVVAGSTESGTYEDFALARYNSNGSLDISFGGDGTVTTDFASHYDVAYAVAIQPDGKIVAAGSSGGNFALARYHTDGSLDTSFGTNGKVTGFGGGHAGAISIQQDGKILAAGNAYHTDTLYDFALFRWNPDGSLDASFGTGGRVTTDLGSTYEYAHALAVRADGKILLAGYSEQPGTGSDFALVRYNTDGSLDTGFDADGRVTTNLGSGDDQAYGVAIQQDGKIVAAGVSEQPDTKADFAVVRYLTALAAPDLQAASDTGVSDVDDLTNDNTPTFDVQSTDTYFRFYRDGVQISGDYHSGTSYTLAPQADGTYDYTVTAVDAAGNESAAGPALSVTVDTAAPTVTARLPSPGSTIGTSSCDVDVTFSETVVGVDASDLLLSGTAKLAGTSVGAASHVSGNTWRFPVTGLGDGTLQISLAPDADDIEDVAVNDLAPDSWSFNVDLIPAVIDRTPPPGTTLNTPDVSLDITFSEPVQGVDAGDLVLTGAAAAGATVSEPTNPSGNTWRFPLSGVSTGTLDVSLAPDAGDIQDLAGQDLANVTWSYPVDVTPPTVISRDPAAGSTIVGWNAAVDVTFSETVEGVDASDLVLSGTAAATASVGTPTHQGGNTWRFPVTGLRSGDLSVALAPDAGDIQDLAGRDLATLTWEYAVHGPLDHLQWNTINSPQYVDVPFSATVTALDIYDHVVTDYSGSADLSGWTGAATTSHTVFNSPPHTSYSSSSSSYTMGYQFTPSSDILVTDVRHYFGSKVSIWSSGGALLASAAVSSTPGTWRETPLATPLQLSAGSTYRVAAYTPGQGYYYRTDMSSAFPHGTINLAYYSSGDVFPTTSSTYYKWWLVGFRYEVGSNTAVDMAPTSVGLVNGVWTGNVTVLEEATDMYLRADDGSGHVADSNTFDVEPAMPLTVTVPEQATEGDGTLADQGTVSIPSSVGFDVVVTLQTDDTTEAVVPSTVTIPAGSTSATFDITIEDDGELDPAQTATITASAIACLPGTDTITVHDNETAVLTVALPASATEGDGTLTGAGTVTVSQAPAVDVVVQLSSNDPGEVTVPATVTILAGQTSATFDVTIVNDTLIDGTQTAMVTAHVENWTDGSDSLDVLDNDAWLTVQLPAGAWENAGTLTGAGSVTLGGTLTSNLVVTLDVDDTSELSVPATVTVLAGQTTATFDVTVVDDTEQDGVQTGTVTASAPGLTGGSQSMLIRDDEVHHFAWGTIGSPKTAGVAFTATLEARNVDDEKIVPFAVTASLSGAGAGGAVNVTPGTTTAFTAGAWSGSVTVNAVATDVVLTANDGSGNTGVSNAFDVTHGAFHHFQWSTVSSPQYQDLPFNTTLTAVDANGYTVTSFNDTVDLSGLVDESSQITIGTSTSAWAFPMRTYYHDSRTQVIYLSSELGEASTITGLALYVSTTPGQTLNSWTIRMQHTSLANYSTASFTSSGWTTVYQANQSVPTTGWVNFAFTTPFAYNGVDNLMIDFSHNNSYYTSTGTCRYSIPGGTRSTYAYTNSSYGSPLSWSGSTYPTAYGSTYVPNVRLTTDASTVSIVPTLATFFGGVWTGDVTVFEEAADMYLRADDGSGHVADSNTFDVEPAMPLTVTVLEQATEGDGTLADQGTVSIPSSVGFDVVVTLQTDDATEAVVPSTVTIPAGSTSATFDITIEDDAELDPVQSVTITASAIACLPGSDTIVVHDNETAVLTVALPGSATEGDGTLAGAGTVTVSEPPAVDVVVHLSSNDPSEVTVPATVTILAGQTSAAFDVTVVNDSLIDGTQTATVTAHVPNWTDGSDSMDVLDNDAWLTVQLPAAAWENAGTLTGAGSVTLGGTLTSNLVVTLGVDDTSELSVPPTVTVLAGQTTATFDVTVVDDTEQDGVQTGTVTASAPGLTGGSQSMLIRDNELHHFTWGTIGSPQTAGVGFAASLEARNVDDEKIVPFTGTASLSGAGAEGAVNVTPAATTAFTAGAWSGSMTVNAVATDVVLSADDGSGNAGLSNAFNVVSGPLDHFAWSTVASPQYIDLPFAATLTAQDARGYTVTGYNGAVTLSGRQGGTGDVTIGTGTSTWSQPLNTYWHDSRTQVIYLQSELGSSTTITGLALYVSTTPGQTLNAWTIRMKHTSLSTYATPSFDASDWTTVYQANRTISTTGWTNFAFSTPFVYNGTSNLLVDFSHNNSSYTSSGYVRSSSPGGTRTTYAYSDSGYGSPLTWSNTYSPTRTGSSYVPNVRLTTSGVSVPITPTTATFAAGVWTGDVTVLQTATAMYLRADDGSGHVADSNTFDVAATPFDFGDAPSPYPTTAASSGARHALVSGLRLGSAADPEGDGQPSADATLDDTTGTPDDEDGVLFSTPLYLGRDATIEVTASAAGRLDAWIDWNDDGDWADADEKVCDNVSLTAGPNTLTVAVPATVTLTSQTFARFRLSSTGGLSFTGAAADGEVEDYAVAIELAPPVLDAEPPATPGTENTISWPAVPGADEYFVQYDDNPDFSSPEGDSGWITGVQQTFTGLTDGVTYYYRLKARNGTAGSTGSWTQTSQSDFDSDSKNNISTAFSPGDVVLATQTLTENFDEAGSSWSSTIFSDIHPAGQEAAFTRSPLYLIGVPNTTPPLPINQGGDQEGRITEVAGGYHGYALTADVPANNVQDVTMDGYVGIAHVVDFSLPDAGFLVRASVDADGDVSGYSVWVQTVNETGSSAILRMMRLDNGVYSYTMASSDSFPVDTANEVYHLRFSARGSSFSASVWRVAVLSGAVTETLIADISRSDSGYASGRVGIQGWVRQTNSVTFDDITITSGAAGYVPAGNIISTPITRDSSHTWRALNFAGTEPADTTLTVDVLPATGSTPIPGYTNVASGTSLAGIADTAIRLRANLSTANSSVTPVLSDWTVTWQEPSTYVESVWSSVEFSTQDATPPEVELDAPAMTADPTPSVTVAASDANGVPDGTAVTIDVDLNNDGDFDDAGEADHTLAALTAGTATFDIVSALSVGPHLLRARVTDLAGNEGSDTATTVINTPPTADAGGPYGVAEEAAVVLDASGSSDPDQAAAMLIYEWDLDGDTVYDDATGPTATFSAALIDGPDAVTVGLRVTDEFGTATTDTATIDVTNVAPTAGISGPAGGLVATPYDFTLSAVDPSPADMAAPFAYAVKWGDGQTTTVSGPAGGTTCSHVYGDFGNYSITVTATDKDGGTSPAAGHSFQIDAATSVVIDAGDFGPNEENAIVVRREGANVVVTVDGLVVLDTALAGLTGGLEVLGAAGNDKLIVDQTGGFVTVPIVYDGGPNGAAPGDDLEVTGGADIVQIRYDMTGPGAGQLFFNGHAAADVTFRNLEPVTITQTGFPAVTDVTINIDDGNGTPNEALATQITDGGNAADNVLFLDAPGAFEDMTFPMPSNSLTINGDADDDDTITVTSVDTGYGATLIINGHGGDDTVNLNGDITFASGNNLDVDLTNDASAGDVDSIAVGAGANLVLSGGGTATLKASRNIALASGSSVEVVDGNLTVEANQLAAPTAGNFAGVDVDGGLLQSTGAGIVTVKGRGGSDAGGSGGGSTGNVGVNVTDSGAISGVGAATVTVTGTGGAGDSEAVVVGGPISAAAGKILIEGVKDGGGLGADVVVDATVTTTGGGDIEIRSDRHVTGGAGGDISSDGAGSDGNVAIRADEDDADGPNGAGTIQLQGDIAAGAGTLTFSLADCDGWLGASAPTGDGEILSAADVTKNGSGALRLNGAANTYSGSTTVNSGYLLVNGTLTLTQSPAMVYGSNTADGTMGGTGTINAAGGLTVDDTGRVDPGDVNSGCAPQPGILTVNANVKFDPGATFNVQLNGLTAGTGYDQLKVNGTVDLSGDVNGNNGSFLTGTSSGLPFGGELRIIDNNLADAIGTRFDGLEEGDFLYAFGQLMNISYRAGENVNDVVLTTPGRFDFDGYNGHTAANYMGVSPFDAYTGPAGDNFGWDVAAPAPASLPPQYFERTYTAVTPCPALPEPELRLDGQSTDSSGTPLRFLLDVEAGKTYEVLILTGDAYWNHDKQQFTVFDTTVYDPNNSATYSRQVVDTWGAGAPDGSGVKVTSGGGTVTACPTYYGWVRLTVAVGGALGTVGQIAVEMQDNGGYDGAAVILGMDVRPVATVGQIVLERTSPTDPATIPPDTSFLSLPADGVTIDSYQGTGAPPGSTITITVSAVAPDATVHYATVLTDADPAMFGTQVTADATGLFTFSVQRPAKLYSPTGTPPVEDWTVTAEEVSGLSRGTALQTYGAPAAEALRFDFGVYGSPVQEYGTPAKKFLEVIPQTTYNATRGYGWTSRVAGAWRKDTVNAATSSNLRTDLNYARNATFKVDLPNGDYSVRVYHSNPMYYGTVPYIADDFEVWAEGTLRYTVDHIDAGTTWPLASSTFNVTVDGGALELQFIDVGGRDGNFVVSGIDISAGGLPGDTPLLAAGDPLDGGAPALSLDALQPVVAEAAARWTAAGLTAEQAARLAHVQYAVADLGGAVLGLANPATNAIRIDDDAASFGWSVTGDRLSVTGDGLPITDYRLPITGSQWSAVGDGLPITDDRSPITGMDLLTVVMHELGHLLGYGHSDGPGDLMAPVLGVKYEVRSTKYEVRRTKYEVRSTKNEVRSGKDEMAETRFDRSSFVLRPSSLAADLASRRDDVFADLGRESVGDRSGQLLESDDSEVLAAATVRPSDEATQARVPRRSRLQHYERELDAWFAELAAEEGDR